MTPRTPALALEGRTIARHPLASLAVPTRWYRRQATFLAGQVEVDGIIRTLWGDMPFYAGDYIVSNSPANHAWAVARAMFEATYVPAPVDAPGWERPGGSDDSRIREFIASLIPGADPSWDLVVFRVSVRVDGELLEVATFADSETAGTVRDRLEALSTSRDACSSGLAERFEGGIAPVEIAEVRIRGALPTDGQLEGLLDDRGDWKGLGLDDVEIFDGPMCRGCGCTDLRACAGGCSWVTDPIDPRPVCSRCYALALAAV